MSHRDLKEELTCPICMELYQHPRRLPCGHSYCHVCLQTMLDQCSLRSGLYLDQCRPLVCPECREEMSIQADSGAEVVPRDFKLSKLVDLFKFMQRNDNSDSSDCEKENHIAASIPATLSCPVTLESDVLQAPLSTPLNPVNQSVPGQEVSHLWQSHASSSVDSSIENSETEIGDLVVPVIGSQAGSQPLTCSQPLTQLSPATGTLALSPTNLLTTIRGMTSLDESATGTTVQDESVRSMADQNGSVEESTSQAEAERERRQDMQSDSLEKLSNWVHENHCYSQISRNITQSSTSLPADFLEEAHLSYVDPAEFNLQQANSGRFLRARSVPTESDEYRATRDTRSARSATSNSSPRVRKKKKVRRGIFSRFLSSETSSEDSSDEPGLDTQDSQARKPKPWLVTRFFKSVILSESSSSDEDSENGDQKITLGITLNTGDERTAHNRLQDNNAGHNSSQIFSDFQLRSNSSARSSDTAMKERTNREMPGHCKRQIELGNISVLGGVGWASFNSSSQGGPPSISSNTVPKELSGQGLSHSSASDLAGSKSLQEAGESFPGSVLTNFRVPAADESQVTSRLRLDSTEPAARKIRRQLDGSLNTACSPPTFYDNVSLGADSSRYDQGTSEGVSLFGAEGGWDHDSPDGSEPSQVRTFYDNVLMCHLRPDPHTALGSGQARDPVTEIEDLKLGVDTQASAELNPGLRSLPSHSLMNTNVGPSLYDNVTRIASNHAGSGTSQSQRDATFRNQGALCPRFPTPLSLSARNVSQTGLHDDELKYVDNYFDQYSEHSRRNPHETRNQGRGENLLHGKRDQKNNDIRERHSLPMAASNTKVQSGDVNPAARTSNSSQAVAGSQAAGRTESQPGPTVQPSRKSHSGIKHFLSSLLSLSSSDSDEGNSSSDSSGW